MARVLLCWLVLGCGEGGPAEGLADGGAPAGFSVAAPVLCLPLQAACLDAATDRAHQCVESFSAAEDPLVERCARAGGTRTKTPCDPRGAECGCRLTTLVSGVCRVVWTFRPTPDPERCRANCESIGGVVLPAT